MAYMQFIFIKNNIVSEYFKVMPVSTRGEIWFKFYNLDSTHFQFFC